MKTIMIVIAAILMLGSCDRRPDITALLENSETRNEIYSAISNHPEHMQAFMKTMRNSSPRMKMMMNDSSMHKAMIPHMRGNRMMMTILMEDEKLMRDMFQMMNNKGVLSEEGMKSCMEKMQAKRLGKNLSSN